MDRQTGIVDPLQQIGVSENAQDVLTLLASVGSYDEDTKWRVLLAGIERLIDIEYEKTEEVIIEHSLVHSGFTASVVQDRLAKWLREDALDRREQVIERLIVELKGTDPGRQQNALSTVLVIGYRTAVLERSLVDLVELPTNSSAQQYALWVLVSLGYTDTGFLESSIISILKSDHEITNFSLRCVRRLAMPALLPDTKALFFRLPIKEGNEKTGESLPVATLYALSAIAEAHPDHSSEIWEAILCRAVEVHEILTHWGRMIDRIDDVRIPDFYLYQIKPNNSDEYHASRWMNPNHPIYRNLSNLTLPNQLRDLHNVINRTGKADQIVAAFHQDATIDTQNLSPAETDLSLLKERCWDSLLMLNLSETKTWVVEALNETSPFTAEKICKTIGFLRVGEAVTQLAALIRKPGWDSEPGLDVSLGMSALYALGSIGTLPAFEALMDSQVAFAKAYDGNTSLLVTTPRVYVVAIASAILALKDVEPLIAHLEMGLANTHARSWLGCAAALDFIADNHSNMLQTYRSRILALLTMDDLKQCDYLHFLVSAAGSMKPDEKAIIQVLKLARDENSPKSLISSAITTLARWGILAEYDDLMAKIGLHRPENNTWWPTRELVPQDFENIVLLYKKTPVEFARLIVDTLCSGSDMIVSQVCEYLSDTRLDKEIVDALLNRVKSIRAARNWDILNILARHAPTLFKDEFPYHLTQLWGSTARRMVAKNYYNLAIDPPDAEYAQSIVEPLIGFLSDPVYDIRRLAGRALLEIDEGRLKLEAEHLLASTVIIDRCHGLDAATWVEDDHYFEQMVVLGRTDREQIVRRWADEAVIERRRSRNAHQYTKIVVAADDDDLLSVWRYAQALRKIGDDQTLLSLYDAMNAEFCAPNKRAFLNYLFDEANSAWTTRLRERENRLEYGW